MAVTREQLERRILDRMPGNIEIDQSVPPGDFVKFWWRYRYFHVDVNGVEEIMVAGEREKTCAAIIIEALLRWGT